MQACSLDTKDENGLGCHPEFALPVLNLSK